MSAHEQDLTNQTNRPSLKSSSRVENNRPRNDETSSSDDVDQRLAREELERDDVSDDAEHRTLRDFRRVSDLEDIVALNLDERLQAQRHQAQRLENLGQLAGGIAHDFNNLLGVILGYASFVAEALNDEHEANWPKRRQGVRNDLAQITKAAERAAALTRQLLAFARQEVVRPQVLNLNEVISSVEEMLRRTIGEHVELVTTLENELWPILADRGQMEQVLVNLAVNARDAMSSGGILNIDTSNIHVDDATIAGGSKAHKGRNVRLRVSDNGSGMPPNVLEHVFEPFFTTKDVDRGSGLGLATVYGILTGSNGQIQIYSEVGTGTTFSITIPVTSEPTLPAVEPVPYERVPQGETVLVVEDQVALREVTARILVRNGYHVIQASNGPEALDLARSFSGEIHLLITDVIMPQMLGKEVAEKMRQIKPRIEVLYMSGYARPVLAAEGRLDPNVALVEKPFSEVDLIQLVGEVLNGNFRGYANVATHSKGDRQDPS